MDIVKYFAHVAGSIIGMKLNEMTSAGSVLGPQQMPEQWWKSSALTAQFDISFSGGPNQTEVVVK